VIKNEEADGHESAIRADPSTAPDRVGWCTTFLLATLLPLLMSALEGHLGRDMLTLNSSGFGPVVAQNLHRAERGW
jgi:hypothetical protein